MPFQDVTFEDVQTFCEQGLPEGTQIDYKREMPQKPEDLAKPIAAFANTSGGLILIGVDEAEDNFPKLPLEGFEKGRGTTERIFQICRDSIYPSILPELSKVVDVPNSPDKQLLVIRIDQSPEAPHAITNSTKVYIRTGNVSKPEELGDIIRIESLFKQRRVAEEKRDAITKRFLDRSAKLFGPNNDVFFWCGIIQTLPTFPSLNESTCRNLLNGKRVAGGSLQTSPSFGSSSSPKTVRYLGKYGEYLEASVFKNLEPDIEDSWRISHSAYRLMNCLSNAKEHIAAAEKNGDLLHCLGQCYLYCGMKNAEKVTVISEYGDAFRSLDSSVVCKSQINWHEFQSSSYQSDSDINIPTLDLLKEHYHSLGHQFNHNIWPR